MKRTINQGNVYMLIILANQFPQLDIYEVDFDINNIIPVFNNFMSKVLNAVNESGKIEDKKAGKTNKKVEEDKNDVKKDEPKKKKKKDVEAD